MVYVWDMSEMSETDLEGYFRFITGDERMTFTQVTMEIYHYAEAFDIDFKEAETYIYKRLNLID